MSLVLWDLEKKWQTDKEKTEVGQILIEWLLPRCNNVCKSDKITMLVIDDYQENPISSAALDLVFYTLDNPAPGVIVYVCDKEYNQELKNTVGRLCKRYSGYTLVLVFDRRCLSEEEEEEGAGSSILLQDLVELGNTVIIDDWPFLLNASSRLYHSSTYQEEQQYEKHAYENGVMERSPRSISSPALSYLPELYYAPQQHPQTQQTTTAEAKQFQQLATDVRDWLASTNYAGEMVLSRSGLAPFLASERISRNYIRNPPTAAHVRQAVEIYGEGLICSSSPNRNNGATIVRLDPKYIQRRSPPLNFSPPLQRFNSSPPNIGNSISTTTATMLPPLTASATLLRVGNTPIYAPQFGIPQQQSPADSQNPTTAEITVAELFARDKRLVDDLYAWLCYKNRNEVSCADLMPFYAAYPVYRKGGGQGSGIKHAITRFGHRRLQWLERKTGGDARIVRIDGLFPTAKSTTTHQQQQQQQIEYTEHSQQQQQHLVQLAATTSSPSSEITSNKQLPLSPAPAGLPRATPIVVAEHYHHYDCPPHLSSSHLDPSSPRRYASSPGGLPPLLPAAVNSPLLMKILPPQQRVSYARRLQNAHKRVHTVVHDYEVVNNGVPLTLKALPVAFKAMHGTDIDPPESFGFTSLYDFLCNAPRLMCCDLDQEQAVRCEPPPSELPFVHDLRVHIAAFAAEHPTGISFTQLKERVKHFGQQRQTSVRFLRGGILGVINSVLVGSVLVQYETNGPFYPIDHQPGQTPEKSIVTPPLRPTPIDPTINTNYSGSPLFPCLSAAVTDSADFFAPWNQEVSSPSVKKATSDDSLRCCSDDDGDFDLSILDGVLHSAFGADDLSSSASAFSPYSNHNPSSPSLTRQLAHQAY